MISKTDSNIPVKRLYSRKVLPRLKKGDNEEPGKFPYTRGLYPNMYRERLWTMRQYSGFGSSEETNKRFKFLLDHAKIALASGSSFGAPSNGFARLNFGAPKSILLEALERMTSAVKNAAGA